MRLPVFVAGQLVESADWAPPAVGDLAEFRLIFVEEADVDLPARVGRVRLELTARFLGEWEGGIAGRSAVQLDGPECTLLWLAPEAVDGQVQLTGYVQEDATVLAPPTLPATWGFVRGIQVEERDIVRPSGDWAPTPPRYRTVPVSPRRFRRSTGPASDTLEVGVLLDVETTARSTR